MKVSFSVLRMENSPGRWERMSERIRALSGTYVYCASGSEEPELERIGKMFRRAGRGAEMIIPAAHTAFPAEECLEEIPVLPLSPALERYRCIPLVNGKLIRRSFLLDCLEKNLHDWIHAPCPDLFLMLFAGAKVSAARTDYTVDRETFLWGAGEFRKAYAWLSALPEPDERKSLFKRRMLHYEDFLLDHADRLNFSGTEKLEFFAPVSVAHHAVSVHPEDLSGMKLPERKSGRGPIRNLAVFCAALRGGGAERCASLMLPFFSALPDLKVFLFQSKEPAPGDYPCPDSVEVVVLPGGFHARYACLPDRLREKRIDSCLFFDHFTDNFYYDILTACEMGIRTIAMEHNTFAFPMYSADIRLLSLRQAVYAGTDIVTCLSHADEFLWNQLGINARYMPNPLTFDPSVSPAFTERKTKNLIFIARMVPGKGVLDALKTLELVRGRHPDARLFMLGSFSDPDFEREIHDFVRQYRLEDSVVFTGFTAEVGEYLRQSSIHLMPSCVEGYPMTMMEAKSYGLPTVSYLLPYLEAGKEEYGTVMVPRRDCRAMAETVAALFDDFPRLNELGRKARESLRHFGNPMVFSRWKALLRWLEEGTEPAELAPPSLSAEEKLRLLGIQTGEMISAASAMNLPAYKNKIMNEELAASRRDRILFDFFLKMYFSLHQKMDSRAVRSGLTVLFRMFWRLKRLYRLFHPWQDREQKL